MAIEMVTPDVMDIVPFPGFKNQEPIGINKCN
jgi:hypothetical protein